MCDEVINVFKQMGVNVNICLKMAVVGYCVELAYYTQLFNYSDVFFTCV